MSVARSRSKFPVSASLAASNELRRCSFLARRLSNLTYSSQLKVPIFSERLDDSVLEENLRKQEEFKAKEAGKFNNVFQVYINPRDQVKADKEWLEEKEEAVRNALNKRMVREGAYDPITLRDRRSGQSVGPLPDRTVSTKVNNAAATQASMNRTGAMVAYALGSDRYGDPEGLLASEDSDRQGLQTAQIDHVQELVDNEARVEAGQHDLEPRCAH